MSTEATNKLKSVQSLIGAVPDGRWGAKSKEAFGALLLAVDRESSGANPDALPAPPASDPAPDVSNDQAPVGPRSEANIETLHPKVRPLARALINRARSNGITIIITSGTRTYAEQDALFRQPNDGRDNDGDGRVDESDEQVTKAPAGHSNHNFGLAFDVTIFSNGKPVWESDDYAAVGKMGRELGLVWGGNWSTPDEPHFELRPAWADKMSEAAMLVELRNRHENGQDAFA